VLLEVVFIGCLGMHRTGCCGQTRLALHVPSSEPESVIVTMIGIMIIITVILVPILVLVLIITITNIIIVIINTIFDIITYYYYFACAEAWGGD